MCPTHMVERLITFLRRTKLGFETHASYIKRNSRRPVGYKLHKAFLRQMLDEEMQRRGNHHRRCRRCRRRRRRRRPSARMARTATRLLSLPARTPARLPVSYDREAPLLCFCLCAAAVGMLKAERTDRRRGAQHFNAGGSLLRHIKNDYKGPRREPRNVGVTVFFGDDTAHIQRPRRARA